MSISRIGVEIASLVCSVESTRWPVIAARMPISAIEILHSNLERRAVTTGDARVFPRLSDLAMVLPATIELSMTAVLIGGPA